MSTVSKTASTVTAIPQPENRVTPGLETAVQVLRAESAALEQLAGFLNDSFLETVSLIEGIEGRVIVTGMGKSGLVGRKIAATLASTGTPSFFVHPAEASHGDMGMIVRGDVVLALSNSGEARELGDLIEYTRRFVIPLIGVTSRPMSSLAQRADIALLLPPCGEACPNGLAPTTSTTLTMALGDALAVTLLKRKGFSESDFKIYHPGGKLGQQLMRVSEIMHTDAAVPLASQNLPMREVIGEISDKGFGCVGLVDDSGVLTGIVTDGDIRRLVVSDFLDRPAAEVMTPAPRTITDGALVAEAMAVMNDLKNSFRKITVLFVIDDAGKPVGLLHIHDCLRAGFA